MEIGTTSSDAGLPSAADSGLRTGFRLRTSEMYQKALNLIWCAVAVTISGDAGFPSASITGTCLRTSSLLLRGFLKVLPLLDVFVQIEFAPGNEAMFVLRTAVG